MTASGVTMRHISTLHNRPQRAAAARVASSSVLTTGLLLRPAALPHTIKTPHGLAPLRPRGPSITPSRRLSSDYRRRLENLTPPSAAPASLLALGGDFMLFLGSIVLVVPVFKRANQSPVLGYLFAGLVMGQLGLFRDVDDLEKLSELGVLFLLFEMGLELSLDKLRSLAKYAFGLGSLQMGITTAAFMLVALPPGEGLMTKLLQYVFHAPESLAKITTIDEALVIAVALSLSSSAFVLQLLKERGELETKFGQATLGILLFQDIATVPFLVLLPLLEGSGSAAMDGVDGMALLMQLGPTVLKTLGALGLVLLGGRTLLRGLFEAVAASRSDEAFFALCLLSVIGASILTQRMGFSDTLGAFVSGVLLSETNFKAQVEADIQPFRGLLLGLFFVTTGASLDLGLLIREWPTVIALLTGLLALKATLITIIGPTVGLTKAESLRTGFALSQGGEFAFVLLALASQLDVLPADLNKLLIIVVVLSMAATPLLTEAGRRVADMVSAADGAELAKSSEGFNIENPVLICGFGDVGQLVANMLDALETPYVAFDLTVARVQTAQDAGFNVLYGDGTRPKVLHAAGVNSPRAIAVGYTARGRAVTAVQSLRAAFPNTPIIVRAVDIRHSAELEEAGASYVVCSETEAGLAVGGRLAEELGAKPPAVASLVEVLREAILDRRQAMVEEDMAVKVARQQKGGGSASASLSSAASMSSSLEGLSNGASTSGVPSSSADSGTSSSSSAAATVDAPALSKVFKFDAKTSKWEGPASAWGTATAAGDSADGGSLDDGAAGLLANIGVSLLGAMGNSREDGNDDGENASTAGNARSSAATMATIDIEAVSVSNSSIAAAAGETEGGALVMLQKGDGLQLELPDGSLECPVDWQDEEPTPGQTKNPNNN